MEEADVGAGQNEQATNPPVRRFLAPFAERPPPAQKSEWEGGTGGEE